MSKKDLGVEAHQHKLWKIIVAAIVVIVIVIGILLQVNVLGLTPTSFQAVNNENVPAAPELGTMQMNGTLANQTAANGTIPSYAHVYAQNNTVVFDSNKIDLLIFSFPNYEAGVVVNKSIPAYDCNAPCPDPSNPIQDNQSLSNSFTIYGLIQPTLVIPRGAILNVTFVNMDSTDHHSFVISTIPPPFAEYIMQGMTVKGEMTAMTPLIPFINSTTNVAYGYQYVLHLNYNTTNMWYMCMFPGHAMAGMYGNITLT